MKFLRNVAVCGLIALGLSSALAQEAAIRKNLAERMPGAPAIDEVSKTPMAGLYEIRVRGNAIFYTDAEGSFLIEGSLIDTRTRRNLTEERVNKLNEVAFDALPLKDAFTIVRGNGKRKLAVFEDPNCSYCKLFERELQKVSNVTVYMFLYPILSPDSADKSRNIWCAKDKGKAWQDLMLHDQPASRATCNIDPLVRNMAFGKKHNITGTPTLIFADGSRVPGAMPAQELEKYLNEAKTP